MNGVLWLQLVSTGISIVPVWFLLSMLLPFEPWVQRLKWLIALDALLALILAMLMIWGWVHP